MGAELYLKPGEGRRREKGEKRERKKRERKEREKKEKEGKREKERRKDRERAAISILVSSALRFISSLGGFAL
jgi:hypothetical protein